MTERKRIFIGGMNRSGTSLMRQLLGSHSEIAIPPTEFGFFERYSIPEGEVTKTAFLEAVEEILQWDKIQKWELDADELRNRARDITRRDARSLFCLFIDQYRDETGKLYAGEKTTNYENRLGTFDEWFSDQYIFVQMVRDPVDTYASQKWYGGSKRSVNTDAWARNWIASIRLGIQRALEFPHRTQLVRYEELTSNPSLHLSEICRKLGVEPEVERMLAMGDFEQTDNSSFQENMNSQASRVGEIRQDDTIDRGSKLTEKERTHLAAYCAESADLLGYKSLQHVDSEIDPQAIIDSLEFRGFVRATGFSIYERVSRRLSGSR